ncbi:MAG: helix-turn-helix transcriptional regulator [Lachnospiraceae bacterium]|nr:helix-turn-helix transcriptional regulator [Lachnospiraceae bacterium]
MSFQKDIKKLRQECLLSQESFAKEIGVSFSTVNRWETGKCIPSYNAMKRIDEFFKNKNIACDKNKWIQERNGGRRDAI